MLFKYISALKGNAKTITKSVGIVVFCIFVFALFACLTAAVITITDFSYDIMPVITALISGISALISGYVLSRIFKENGLLCGFFAASVIFLSMVLLSLYYNTFGFSSILLLKLVITYTPAAIGGIIGVNTN